MSETTEAASAVEAAPQVAESAATPPEAQASTAAETGAQPEVAAEPEKPAEPPPKPKPSQADRRFAHLTAKAAETARERDTALARAAAAEALLAASKPKEADDAPSSRAVPTQDAVREEAAKLLARQNYEAKLADIAQKGATELGRDTWTEKTGILADLGAQANPTFMETLVELDNGPALVAHLADDADELMALLRLPPVAMAARMGKMAAKLESTPAAPAAAPKVSAAPAPVRPVSGRATPAPDVYDSRLSMAEYVKLRAKQAPRSLGGRGEAA